MATRLATHSPAAIHSAPRNPKRFASNSSVLNENSVPSRLTVSAIPNPSASSLPVNQRAMIALCATIIDSEPTPNTSRPRYITGRLGALATIAAPATTSAEKIMLARRTPARSTSTPPASTAAIAARLYIEYMLPIAARFVWNTWMRVVSIAPTLS